MKTYSELTREERIKKILEGRRKDLALVLENLSEENNISAILRTAEAFGVELVCIIYPKGEKPRISKGATSGAYKWLKIKYYKSTGRCFNYLKNLGFRLIGALVDPETEVLWEKKFGGKIAIIVGNEVNGLSKEARKQVDQNIYLPMFGLTESLNVGVAAGIFLYEVIRQKLLDRRMFVHGKLSTSGKAGRTNYN